MFGIEFEGVIVEKLLLAVVVSGYWADGEELLGVDVSE